MGLAVSLSLTAFLVLLAKPELPREIREKISRKVARVSPES
jgi:hypothetical protein